MTLIFAAPLCLFHDGVTLDDLVAGSDVNDTARSDDRARSAAGMCAARREQDSLPVLHSPLVKGRDDTSTLPQYIRLRASSPAAAAPLLRLIVPPSS